MISKIKNLFKRKKIKSLVLVTDSDIDVRALDIYLSSKISHNFYQKSVGKKVYNVKTTILLNGYIVFEISNDNPTTEEEGCVLYGVMNKIIVPRLLIDEMVKYYDANLQGNNDILRFNPFPISHTVYIEDDLIAKGGRRFVGETIHGHPKYPNDVLLVVSNKGTGVGEDLIAIKMVDVVVYLQDIDKEDKLVKDEILHLLTNFFK